jgi:hypothetical protein
MIEKDSFSITLCVKPKPSTPNIPKQNGPTSTPATRYAVTAGRFTSFARRESISPANNAIDKLNKTVITLLLKNISFSFSLNDFNTLVYICQEK